MTAPAVMPGLMPMLLPMPIKAMPTVAEVDHELPVAKEMIEQITKEAARKIVGERICNP